MQRDVPLLARMFTGIVALTPCLVVIVVRISMHQFTSLNIFDSNLMALYVNGSGCASFYEVPLTPESARPSSHIARIEDCRWDGQAEGVIIIHTHKVLPYAVFRDGSLDQSCTLFRLHITRKMCIADTIGLDVPGITLLKL